MRMRRKKNLYIRQECCRPYLLEADTECLDARQAIEDKHYVDISSFDTNKPLILELGCGKGRHAITFATRHKECNYLAVEKLTNVIIAGAEYAKENQIENLRFLCTSAEYLPRFLPDHSIDRIIINFPCPFHKESYHEKRMTDKRFLAVYDTLLKQNGTISLKTDNKRMFAYSIEQLSQYGFILENVTLDLHNSPYAENNIITEYEQKFLDEGLPILSLRARKK